MRKTPPRTDERTPSIAAPRDSSIDRMILKAGAAIIGAYLVLRGIAEFFLIDLGDASTYRHDWGGPSPAGVLAVHCGPALLIVGYLVARHFTKGTPR